MAGAGERVRPPPERGPLGRALLPPEREPLVRRTRRLLAASIDAHIRRPLIGVAAVAGAVAFFLLDTITGPRRPGARELAGMFAPPPLDAFSDLKLVDGRHSRWVLALAFPMRVVLVAAVLSLVLGSRPTARRVAKLALVYLASTAAFAIPFGMAVLFLSGFRSGGPSTLLLIAVHPIVHAALAVLFAPLAARAISGERLRPSLLDPPIWIFAAISTWLWLLVPGRIEAVALSPEGGAIAYAVALTVVLAQSLLLGAMALGSTGSTRRATASEG